MKNDILMVKGKAASLTKEQQKLNKLLAEVEKMEHLVKEHQAALEAARRGYQAEILPLMKEKNEQLFLFLLTLDNCFDKYQFPEAHKLAVSEFIIEQAFDLASVHIAGAEELYTKYAESSYQEEKAHQSKMMADHLRDMFEDDGIEFDADMDWNDEERVMQFFAEQEKRMEEQEKEERLKQKSKEKKSKTELKREAEETEVQKLARSIYLDLVREFHPDKVQDEKLKAEATEKFKLIATAYESLDILALFKLQIEMQNVDESVIGGLATDRLRLLNKSLQEKVNESKFQINGITDEVRAMLDTYVHKLTLHAISPLLQIKGNSIRRGIMQLKADMESCKTPKGAKAMFKLIDKEQEETFFPGDFF